VPNHAQAAEHADHPGQKRTPTFGTPQDSGVTPKIVSDRIGHSDLSVTFQVYGHRSTGQDREAAELVAKLIHEALGLSSER
jgi:integrase